MFLQLDSLDFLEITSTVYNQVGCFYTINNENVTFVKILK